MRLRADIALLLACIAVAGCGGEDEKAASPVKQAAAAPEASASEAAAVPAKKALGLPKPIYATCGVDRFEKPAAEPLLGGAAQYWRVIYQVPVTAPRVKDRASLLTIVEQAPSGKRGGLEGAREIVVGGHKVSLREGNAETPAHVARWKTEKARYTLLADGSLGELRRIIGCFP